MTSSRFSVRGFVVLVTSLLFASAEIAVGASRYVVIDLGVLQEGEGSCACGVNDNGQVVGFGMVRPFGGAARPRAFLWENGVMTDLGTLGADEASVARRVNNAGYIVGWSERLGVRRRAVMWESYWGIRDLRTLGGTSSAALGLNAASTVVGWSDVPGGTYKHGFEWFRRWMSDLGDLPDAPNTVATAINSIGQIVGFASSVGPSPTERAILWEYHLPYYIMPENARNCADDINDLGLVAGYYAVTNLTGPTRHACVWDLEQDTVADLGVLPGDNASRAVAINEMGKVVGHSWLSANPFEDPEFGLPETAVFRPFLYDPTNGTILNLRDLIPPGSGYTLNWVCDINNSDWIAGAALVDIGGGTNRPHAVLLLPDPTITGHPTNQEYQVGETAVFTLTVVGTEPLSYQWWKGNAPLPGQTNATLTLTNLQTADAGWYFAVVTNQFGSATSRLALLTVNSIELDPQFIAHVNGAVYAVAQQPDGKVLVAGQFDRIADQPRTNLARLNTDGTVDVAFDIGMPGATAEGYSTFVRALLVQPDGKIVLGGYFDAIAGQPRTNIARVLADGAVDPGFSPHVIEVDSQQAEVKVLAVQPDGKILVGGEFVQVGDTPRTNIARLNPDGSVDPEFSPAVGTDRIGVVWSVVLQADGEIIVVGDFYSVNDEYRPLIARLNADGSLDAEFTPEIRGGEWPMITAVTLQDDCKILLGGLFSTVNDLPRANVARLNPDGSVDPGFAVHANGAVNAFSQQTDGKLVLAGSFSRMNGVSRVGVARVDRDGALDPNFNPAIDSFEYGWPWMNALGLQSDGKILLSGEFDMVDGKACTNLARLFNTAPAVENLVVDGTGILWTRTGSCPEVWRTTFEYSLDGQTWYSLGTGTRTANGWRLDGVSIPDGSMVRARGYLTGGQSNGSSWFVETVVTPVLPIRLRIQLIGADVLLSWTGGRPPFQVQKTYELTSPVSWTDVGEPVWTNAMVLSVGQSNVFFRVYGQ